MTPVVRREEVDPGPLRAQGPRVAVLVSLNFPGMTEHVAGLVRSFTRTALESLAEAGARHTLIDTSDHAALDDPARTAAGHDGLLLLGGGDADPALYGLTGPAPNSYGVDRRADDHSIAAIRAAVAAGRPVLGICRGSQLINLAYGGTLIPDLEDYHLHHGPPGAPLFLDEKVTVLPGTRLSGLVSGPRLTVRSGHHQAVAEVGEGLTVAARADDGVIEAVEHPAHWLVGVQWHPEDPAGSATHRREIFTALTTACARGPR